MAEQQIPSPHQQPLPQAENLLKAILLPTLLLTSCLAATRLVEAFGSLAAMPWWGFLALLMLALWNSVLVIGMGILGHEAVHRVLFRHPFANELIGGLLSVLALIPFYANRQFHLTHHSYAHQPGRDPEEQMHNVPFASALVHGSLVALQLQYRLLFDNLRNRFDQPRYRTRVLRDLALISCSMLFYAVLVPALGIDPRYSLLPTLLVLPLVFGVRALSDHYGLPAAIRRSANTTTDSTANDSTATHCAEAVLEAEGEVWTRSQRHVRDQISGWVILTNPLLEWLWSHVNYHEVHHKFPWLAHSHLKPVFEATRAQLPYRIAHGYCANLLRLARLPYYASAPEVDNIRTAASQ